MKSKLCQKIIRLLWSLSQLLPFSADGYFRYPYLYKNGHFITTNSLFDPGYFGLKSGSILKSSLKPPLIIEEDIAIDREQNSFRLGLRWDKFPHKKWKNQTIPYKISDDYGPRERSLIESALKTFEFLTCLKFQVWDGKQKDYLYIHQSKIRPGCWSYIGRRGGRQDLSLRPPDSKSCHCLCNVGRVLHEMMHALGFYHEHSRPDRDKYIKIVTQNIKKGKLKNFNKVDFSRVTTQFDYDYDSIMHYGHYFFSKERKIGKETIKPLKVGAKIGQRSMLSKIDCMKVNQQFGCFDKSQPWRNKKIQILCGMLGFSFN